MACWRRPADELHNRPAQAECDLLDGTVGLPRFADKERERELRALKTTADRHQQRQNSMQSKSLSDMPKAATEDIPNEACVGMDVN